MMSSDSAIFTPVLGSTRKGKRVVPSSLAFGRKLGPFCGVGYTTTSAQKRKARETVARPGVWETTRRSCAVKYVVTGQRWRPQQLADFAGGTELPGPADEHIFVENIEASAMHVGKVTPVVSRSRRCRFLPASACRRRTGSACVGAGVSWCRSFC